jgi:hypothetical protein
MPNFWNGFKNSDDAKKDLSIGKLDIGRSTDSSGDLFYSVKYFNIINGEFIDLNYICTNDKYRTLKKTWKVNIENNAPDIYSKFNCTGKLKKCNESIEINLQLNNGSNFNIGIIPYSTPITCNWTLFDTIPALSEDIKTSPDGEYGFAILENLDKLKPSNHLKYIGKWVLSMDGSTLNLEGYCLYGTGNVPSYWWLDENNYIVLMSTVFHTYILEEIKLKSSPVSSSFTRCRIFNTT